MGANRCSEMELCASDVLSQYTKNKWPKGVAHTSRIDNDYLPRDERLKAEAQNAKLALRGIANTTKYQSSFKLDEPAK